MSDITPDARFMAKVQQDDDCDCWLWIGTTTGASGYGRFWNGTRMVLAHRWAYEHYVGLVPAGLELDHVCRERSCVNPDHLEAVTHSENMKRSPLLGMVNRAKTTCRHGHLLDVANTYWEGRKRRCRICGAAKARRYRERQEAAR